MEGGEDGEAAKEEDGAKGMEGMEGNETKPNPFNYGEDKREYNAWDQTAAALLRNMLVNPIFGDIMKANAVSWEYNREKTTAYSDLSRACALVSAAAAQAVSGENEVFISGYVDQESLEALNDLAAAEKKTIHFPFVTAGWEKRDDATNAFDHIPINPKKKDSYTRVLFEVSGAASVDFAGCRRIVHRLNANIESNKEENGVHVFVLKANKVEAQTIADWKKAQESSGETAAAADDGKKEDEAPKEDDKKEDDKKDEGAE